MVDGQAIQDKITAVLTRADLKKSAEIWHYEETENDYGEPIFAFSYQDVIEGIVLNYKAYGRRYDAAGTYNKSSYIYLIPATVCLNEKLDTIYIFDKEYKITNIEAPASVGEILPLQRVFLEIKK